MTNFFHDISSTARCFNFLTRLFEGKTMLQSALRIKSDIEISSRRRNYCKYISQVERSSMFVYIFHIYYCYSPKNQPPEICFF